MHGNRTFVLFKFKKYGKVWKSMVITINHNILETLFVSPELCVGYNIVIGSGTRHIRPLPGTPCKWSYLINLDPAKRPIINYYVMFA